MKNIYVAFFRHMHMKDNIAFKIPYRPKNSVESLYVSVNVPNNYDIWELLLEIWILLTKLITNMKSVSRPVMLTFISKL